MSTPAGPCGPPADRIVATPPGPVHRAGTPADRRRNGDGRTGARTFPVANPNTAAAPPPRTPRG
ncbi:hypothetical protein ACWEF9_30395 [Streptomyces sp. NPDC004980]